MTHAADESPQQSPEGPNIAASETSPQPGVPGEAPHDSSSRDDGGILRPFVNERLNSRLGKPLPSTAWKIRWQTEVTGGLNPSFVLQARDRILAHGIDLWQLFNADGKSLAVERLGRSHVVLDPANALFYHASRNGTLTGRRLSDGGQAFILRVLFGPEFERNLIARRGRRMLVVSIERPVGPDTAATPETSLVEVQDLGDPLTTDDLGFLTSAKRLGSLDYLTTLLSAALNEETLAFATPDNLYLADMDLKVRNILKAKFEPVAMSLDEAGRIYLLVRAEGRTALWLLSPAGERLMAFTMPSDLKLTATPPIVGYNHRVYILGTDRVLAINPDGKLAWVEAISGQSGGAVMTADEKLLISDGRELAVFNSEGQRSMLYNFGGDILTTPPILTAGGEILVASQHRLYSLTPKPPAAK